MHVAVGYEWDPAKAGANLRKRAHAEGGGNCRSLVNQALLRHIAREDDVPADTLRRVLREERAGYAVKPRAGRGRAR